MNVSNKTITTLLTISICINIFCLGFMASKEFSPKRHRGAPLAHHMEVKKHKNKKMHEKMAGSFNQKAGLHKAMYEGIAEDREQIAALRKDIAEIIKAQDVDFAKIAELLREIRTVENTMRDKMERKFLERLSQMNGNERQEFIEKMQARKNLGRP